MNLHATFSRHPIESAQTPSGSNGNRLAWQSSVELQPAFDSVSEDGNSSSDYYRVHQDVNSMTANLNGPPIPPRSKPPTPPPYNAAVKRGISPPIVASVQSRCSGLCSCPYCPVKNGIPLSYFSLLPSASSDLFGGPVQKQPRGEDMSSASDSPRNGALYFRSEGAASEACSSGRSQVSSLLQQNSSSCPPIPGSRPPVIRDIRINSFLQQDENYRPMSPASSEMSSSIFSDTQSEVGAAAGGSPLLTTHVAPNLASTNSGFAVLPSKKQLPPTYLKSINENNSIKPPPIPPKKAPPPYAPPPPPGQAHDGASVLPRQGSSGANEASRSNRSSPSKRSSAESSGGGGSQKSGDDLSSTLKNSCSVTSFAAYTGGVDETDSATPQREALNDISRLSQMSPGDQNGRLSQRLDACSNGTSPNSAQLSSSSHKLVKKQSANAFKFYMEQHMEKVMSFPLQREKRRTQMEKELSHLSSGDKAELVGNFNKCESELLRRRRCKIAVDSFTEIDQLGIGGFGEVKLVRYREDAQLYAMKVLNKAHILKKNQAGHVRAERDILAEADNEWVVKLFFSFQDKHNLYLVMEYIPGGDLMSLLIKKDYFPEPMARFYTAEMILAIESVHELGFIHRDIKPDNILVDRAGHIKLTDFGLCTGFRWTHSSKYYQNGKLQDPAFEMDDEEWEKIVQQDCNCCRDPQSQSQQDSSSAVAAAVKPLDRYKRLQRHRCLAHSLVGTPNYIAPELLMKVPYDKSCDWWSVGVILYEMVLGRPPFCAETPAETQYRVLNWKKFLQIPRNIMPISPNCVSFIQQICCDQRSRLGSRSVQDLKEHPFLSSLPFEELRNCTAPYIPEIRHEVDTQHFQSEDGHVMAKPVNNSDYQPDHTLKHPDHAFYEFTYRRPNPNLSSSAKTSPDLSKGSVKIPKSKSHGSGLAQKLFKSSTNLAADEESFEEEKDDDRMDTSGGKHSSQKSGGSMAKRFLNGLRSFKSSENLMDESVNHDQTFISVASQNSNKSSSRRDSKGKTQPSNLHHRRHSSELEMDLGTSSRKQDDNYVQLNVKTVGSQVATTRSTTYQFNAPPATYTFKVESKASYTSLHQTQNNPVSKNASGFKPREQEMEIIESNPNDRQIVSGAPSAVKCASQFANSNLIRNDDRHADRMTSSQRQQPIARQSYEPNLNNFSQTRQSDAINRQSNAFGHFSSNGHSSTNGNFAVEDDDDEECFV